MVELDACNGVPREAKLLCPQTALAVALPLDGPRGAENFSTREFLPSETYRLPCESKANAVGVSRPEPETCPPRVGGAAGKILLSDHRVGGGRSLAVQHSRAKP